MDLTKKILVSKCCDEIVFIADGDYVCPKCNSVIPREDAIWKEITIYEQVGDCKGRYKKTEEGIKYLGKIY